MELARLALTHLQAGRLREAEAASREALVRQPNQPQALLALAFALHGQNRHAESVPAFRSLARLQPEGRHHHVNLGTALRAAGDFDGALAAYAEALRRGEDSADFLLNLGLLHIDRFEHGKARAVLARAAERAPHDPEIALFRAQSAYEQVEHDEAGAALRGWRAFERLDAGVLVRAGTLLMQLGDGAEAQAAFEEALRRAPGDALARVRLAQLHERNNQLEAARSLAPALPADATPELREDHLSLQARLAERARDWSAARAHYEALLALNAPEHQRYHVLFPLARVHDALGDAAGAMEVLRRAHASQMAFLGKAAARIVDPRRPALGITGYSSDPADVAAWDHSGAPPAERSPVFIVGFPRSGTTLLEQMLDAHPRLRSMDEQPYLQNAIDQMAGPGVRYPEQLAALSASQLDAIRSAYWQRVAGKVALAPGQRLVDKNPLNLLRLPAISRLFPHARVILAIRHPCDTILSNYFQHYRAPEIAGMCRDLPTLAAGYVRAFDFWYRQQQLLGPAVFELVYEDYVADLAGTARRLTDFLDLPWDDAMLDPAGHARERGYISTPSYSQVVEPVSRKAVGRWRRYEQWLAPVRPIVAPYLERWRYD